MASETLFDVQDPQEWSRVLGLMAVPLLENTGDRHVFLNGTRGNFCLQTRPDPAEEGQGRDIAWSADVGHYLSLEGDVLQIQRWDLPRHQYLRFPLRGVHEDPIALHDQLERAEPRRDMSVVPHFIGVFRRLRALLSNATGHDSLQAFLLLLAAATDRVGQAEVQIARWGLDAGAIEIARAIAEEQWNLLIEALTKRRATDQLMPLPDLVLRHASGLLCEEAHYHVSVEHTSQLSLYPKLPAPALLTTRDVGSVGVHFTPAALARSIVEEALRTFSPTSHAAVFDPACGSGEFLREAHRQLRQRGFAGPVELHGWDMSPAAESMARFVLSRECSAWPSTTVKTRVCNSLLELNWVKSDLLLMNPPFVSWNELAPKGAEAVRSVLGPLALGKPDMACAFLRRAVDSLGERGVIGTVLPASVMDGKATLPLREYVSERVKPTLIARLGSQHLFQGAMVDAALLVTARAPLVEPAVLWADHRPASITRGLRELRIFRRAPPPAIPREGDGFSVHSELEPGVSSWRPQPYAARRRLQRLKHFPRVVDLFDVRMGVRTGLNSAFLLSPSELESLPAGERKYFRPAIVNESINRGAVTPVVNIFYPYSDGRLVLATERSLRQHTPQFYSTRLLPNKDALRARKSIRARQWWELAEPRLSWQTKRFSQLLTTYFGRAGSFAYDADGTYVIVQGHSWRPKVRRFNHDVGLAYVALLASPLMDEFLAGVSDSVGGGQWNLSPQFVARLPIPDLAESETGLVLELSSAGRALAEGEDVHETQLRALGLAAYGLSE